jgi:hypothetical protein
VARQIFDAGARLLILNAGQERKGRLILGDWERRPLS